MAQVKSSGEFIDMGTCIACQKPWGMYASEKEFFEKLIEEKGYTMPKRCPTCRKEKRKVRDTVKVSIPVLIDRIHKIAQRAEEGGYVFADQALAAEIREIAADLRTFVSQHRVFFTNMEKHEND